MKMDFKIRIAQQSDSAELRDLYKNTVLVVNRRDYSPDEVEDWASCGDDLSNIEEMIKTHYFIVAVNQRSQIVGFASIIQITSEVSLTARPFFEKQKYVVKKEQKRQANKLNLTNFWMAKTLSVIKPYHGRIPACGVFCGGCPSYTRDEKICQGAEENKTRCEKCRTFYLCCVEKGITHCYQCHLFPCTKFKGFTKRWLKYGQDFIENQKFLKQVGEMEFLRFYNEKVTD